MKAVFGGETTGGMTVQATQDTMRYDRGPHWVLVAFSRSWLRNQSGYWTSDDVKKYVRKQAPIYEQFAAFQIWVDGARNHANVWGSMIHYARTRGWAMKVGECPGESLKGKGRKIDQLQFTEKALLDLLGAD